MIVRPDIIGRIIVDDELVEILFVVVVDDVIRWRCGRRVVVVDVVMVLRRLMVRINIVGLVVVKYGYRVDGCSGRSQWW